MTVANQNKTSETSFQIDYGNDSPKINLILAEDEHPDIFWDILVEKVKDTYKNKKIIALVNEPKDEKAGYLNATQNENEFFTWINISNYQNINSLIDEINSKGISENFLWVKGNDSIFTKMSGLNAYQIQSYERIDDYFQNTKIQHSQKLPEFISLSLTEICNYKCFFCRDHNKGRPKLSIDDFYRMKSIIQNAKVLDITGWGEPLSVKYIKEALEFINENNKNNCIQITTNGSLLTEEIAELLSQNLHKIIISINAATKETYNRDMVNGKWDILMKNITNARKYIDGDKWVLSFVGHSDNIEEYPLLVRLADEFGIKNVSVTSIIVTEEYNLNKSLWFIKDKTDRIINEARALGEALGISVGGRKFSDPVPLNQAVDCNFPNTEAYLTVAGDVSPCCYSSGNTMGNIYLSGSFENVWNNPKYRRLREERYLPECKSCFVYSDLNELNTHLFHSKIPKYFKLLPKVTYIYPINFSDNLFLEENIEMIQKQTYSNIEVVFVGKPENLGIAREIFSKTKNLYIGLKFVKEFSKELYKCLNTGIAEAEGEYISFVDPDSVINKDSAEQILKYLYKSENEGSVMYAVDNPVTNFLTTEEWEDFNIFGAAFKSNVFKDSGNFDIRGNKIITEFLAKLKNEKYQFKFYKKSGNLSNLQVMLNKAGSYLQNNDYKNAIHVFKVAIKIKPDLIDAHLNLGLCYLNVQDYDNMATHFHKVIELDPNFRPAVFNLGRIYIALNKKSQARKVLSDYLQNHPNDTEINSLYKEI